MPKRARRIGFVSLWATFRLISEVFHPVLKPRHASAATVEAFYGWCAVNMDTTSSFALFPVYPEEFLPTYQTINEEATLTKTGLVSLNTCSCWLAMVIFYTWPFFDADVSVCLQPHCWVKRLTVHSLPSSSSYRVFSSFFVDKFGFNLVKYPYLIKFWKDLFSRLTWKWLMVSCSWGGASLAVWAEPAERWRAGSSPLWAHPASPSG